MRPLAVLASILLVFSGCVGGGNDDVAPTTSDEPKGIPDFKPVENQTAAPIRNTLEAPPQWRQAEWWKIKLKDPTGATWETTRVVAGQENDDYLIGMPGDAFSDELMTIHLPGFGQVSKKDLSYEVHNVRFEPLRFPLTEGATWETAFEGSKVKAVVHAVNETRARVQMDGPTHHINATYDSTIGEIVEYRQKGYADYDVVAHGYEYSRLVTVPHMFKLVFQYARIGPVLNAALGPQQPSDTAKLDTGFDRVSFVLLFAAVAGPTAGYYDVKATAPGNKAYQLTVKPGDPALVIKTFAQDFPGGDWKFDFVTGGPGILVAEGVAYHVYDIEMPGGRILPSTGEHHHGHG
jgi:hypothetical protein